MPGFDEHERHSFVDSSQQAVGEACTLLPCAAKSSMPPAGQPPASGSVAVTNMLTNYLFDLQGLYTEMLIGCLPHSRILQLTNSAVQKFTQNQQHQQQSLGMHSSHMIACTLHPPVDHTRRAAAQNNVGNPTAGRCMLQLQRPTAASNIPSGMPLAILLSML